LLLFYSFVLVDPFVPPSVTWVTGSRDEAGSLWLRLAITEHRPRTKAAVKGGLLAEIKQEVEEIEESGWWHNYPSGDDSEREL